MPVATSSVTGFGLRLLEQLGPGSVAFSPLSVHACLHKARVDLDEEGTRAAAVTAITAVATGAVLEPPPPFDLRLDRPFLWAIEHRESGTLLFLGRVTDPSTT